MMCRKAKYATVKIWLNKQLLIKMVNKEKVGSVVEFSRELSHQVSNED